MSASETTASAPLPEDQIRLIEQFADALWMERGLSKNTLAAYQNDLRHAALWLVDNNSSLNKAGRQDLSISVN